MRHGFWCHWKWVIWCFACFWGPRKYACTKIFYSWNSVTLDFEGHICQIIHFEDTYGALGNFFLEKKSLFFDVNYDQKWQLKVWKKSKLRVQKFEKKSWFLYVFSGTELFFEYKTIAKKTCAPKTRATLAMPKILVRRRLCVVVCRRMWTFLCPD